jgi:hypothetical protein
MKRRKTDSYDRPAGSAKNASQKNCFVCADEYEKQGRLSEAVALYRVRRTIPGANEALLRRGYALAKVYEADGDIRRRRDLPELGDYLDAVERGEVCRYAMPRSALKTEITRRQ